MTAAAAPPTAQPGQLALLLRHELRLIWRGSPFGGRHGVALILVLAVLLHLVGYGVALGFTHFRLDPADQLLAAMLALLFVGGLMLSQAVQRASELLDDRTDLGWLLSTPVPPRLILIVRLLAVAGSVSLYWLLLLVPLADGMLLLGRSGLLGIYPVLAVLALLVTCAGFTVTFGLLRLTNVRRTRALANALATLIGATVFLAGQSRSLLPPGMSDRFWHSFTPSAAASAGAAWLPARALLGEPVPMLILSVLAFAAAAATAWALQLWFAAGAQAVVAASTSHAASLHADKRRFHRGSHAALLAKELLLLRRYPGLTGLAAYYLIYLVPAVATIWRSTGDGTDARLLGAAPVLSAGELARLFVSVTMMGDEAAELVRTAPVTGWASDRAKLSAAALGVAVILAIPVGGLAISLPDAIPAMAACICGNVGCNLMLGLWRPAPIRRTDLRRNHKGWGGLVNVAGFVFSACWSVAAWQMLRGSWWAVVPVCVALIGLFLCKPAKR